MTRLALTCAALALTLAVGCARHRLGQFAPCSRPADPAQEFAAARPCPLPKQPPPPDVVEAQPKPLAPPPDAVTAAETAPTIILATATTPAPEPAPPAPAPKAQPKGEGGDRAAVKTLADAAKQKVDSLRDFECRLTKREVVQGKKFGPDEVQYRFRAQPLSVAMTVLSDAGQGRKVLYVQGQNDGKMAIITGKGDSPLTGAGYRTNLDPDSKQATAKTRYKVTEAGFARTVNALLTAVADESRPVKPLGLVTRPEAPYALEGVEVIIPSGVDPLMSKGGKRRLYFDPKPDSPGYRLPVVVEAFDAAGAEVEYYHYGQLKAPANLPDSTWDFKALK